MRTYILSSFLLLFVLLPLSQSITDDSLSYEAIATTLKASFQGRDAQAELLRHWQLLDIITSDGQLNPLIPELLPYVDKLTQPEDPASYIDRAVACLSKNPYLNKVVSQIKTIDPFKGDDLQYLLFSATTYGMALDAFATIARDDYRVMKGTLRHWNTLKLNPDYYKLMTPFGEAKYDTVFVCLSKWLVAYEAGFIVHNNGAMTIPLNILEAILNDIKLGFTENAQAGAVLKQNNPGHLLSNDDTGAGPTSLDQDPNNWYSKAISYHFPLSQNWDDLYSVWNMAFVSHYVEWPFFIAKLATPAVSCYQERPNEYLTFRGLDLWMHVNWYNRLKLKPGYYGNIDWVVSNFTKEFGKINAESAKDYQSKVETASVFLS